MVYFQTPGSKRFLDSFPTDLLSHIALASISSNSSIPTPRELSTLRSLLLTCRTIHDKLSLVNNPKLYANILRNMFDVHPERRMGIGSATPSALASELKLRIEALKSLKIALGFTNHKERSFNIDSVHLIRLFLMMTENDSKNLHQFIYFVDISRLAGFLCSYLSTVGTLYDELARNPHFVLVIALMWLCFEGTPLHEELEFRTEILDMLEPYVLSISPMSDGTPDLHTVLHGASIVTTIKYFGILCSFKLPSVVPFARLCTVDRYNMMKRRSRNALRIHKKNIARTSSRFDLDCARYLAVDSALAVGTSVHSFGTLAGLWNGAWFIPCYIKPFADLIMCTRPMRLHLREYVSLHVDSSASLLDGHTRDAAERAWFPEGVVFEENVTSLRVYDPMNSQWISYEPRTELLSPLDIVDVIIIGKTESSHGAKYGNFNFHGRIRREDGQVVIVRKPADTYRQEFGTWVFRGHVHGSTYFVGEWRAVSNVKHACGQGWFHWIKSEAEDDTGLE